MTQNPSGAPKGIGRGPAQAARPDLIAIIAAVVAALATVLYGIRSDWDAATPAMTAFFAAIAAGTAVDIQQRRIPNKLVAAATPLVGALLVVAAIADDDGRRLVVSLVGGTILMVGFFALHALAPKSLGAGDVKIAFMLGLAIGWFGLGQLQWFLIWIVVGLSIALVITRRRGGSSKDLVAFMPTLAAAATLTILLAA
jgi:leader peptidase (prepilin peptidase)/N-methyltransferase